MTCSRPALVCLVLVSFVVIAGCSSDSPAAPSAGPVPAPPTNEGTARLSGVVFDVQAAGRVPAAGIPLTVVVTAPDCLGACGRVSSSSQFETISGRDGRYQFAGLPAGSAFVVPRSPGHRQVCGAGIDLFRDTRLDVEITSRTNPRRSPFLTPLEISGQVYETTIAGHVGVSGAMILVGHRFSDLPFFTVTTDDRGFFSVCGVPARWPIGFTALRSGFRHGFVFQEFGGNTTMDIELLRE